MKKETRKLLNFLATGNVGNQSWMVNEEVVIISIIANSGRRYDIEVTKDQGFKISYKDEKRGFCTVVDFWDGKGKPSIAQHVKDSKLVHDVWEKGKAGIEITYASDVDDIVY